MLKHLLSLSRNVKRVIAIVVDSLCLIFSFWFAQSVRFEAPYIPNDPIVAVMLLIAVPTSILLFVRFGLYRAIVRYMGPHNQLAVIVGVTCSAMVLFLASEILAVNLRLSAVIIYALTSIVLIGGSRTLMRASYQRSLKEFKRNVIIYGAGAAGRQLANALNSGNHHNPVSFIDDDITLHKSSIMGLRVHAPSELERLIKKHAVDRVLLAMPSAARSRRREILEFLEPLKVAVQTIPGMVEMVDGQMKIDELQEVRIEDLLGRDPVEPRKRLLEANIRGKVVMVTGAGGSIGSELCRQIIYAEPAALVLYELSEYGLYAIERELQLLIDGANLEIPIYPLLGTVQRQNRIENIMRGFKVQTVYHAAAYKHVPMVEFNIVEGVRNNVFGTWFTAEAAVNAGVETFVLISTDKAVRPTNVMGATKRMAELVLQAMATRQTQTRFCMVRFGNVLGSSGSVIPLFRQQIIDGGPVTVTDKEITRYFMTIPEAAQLVIQAGAMGSSEKCSGGDVFVLDMGEPVKIDELARKLIRLMGLEVKDAQNPHGDIEITYSGLRPGEKLYEELLIGDDVAATEHPRIMTAQEVSLSWEDTQLLLSKLDQACHAFLIDELHRLLQEAPTGFTPSCGINDLVWCAEHEIASPACPDADMRTA